MSGAPRSRNPRSRKTLKKTFKISDSLNRQLTTYAQVASAAGVSVLALAGASEAFAVGGSGANCGAPGPGMRKQYLHRCHQKPKGVAKVAAARKLAVRLYWMLRTNVGYPEIVRIESSPRVAWSAQARPLS